MKKLQLLTLVGLVTLVLATVPAGAFTFAAGDTQGKMNDYGSFYLVSAVGGPATPLSITDLANLPAAIASGATVLDRTLFVMTSLSNTPPSYSSSYYANTPASVQLIGMVYDLQVASASITSNVLTVNLKGTGGLTDSGGVVDVWELPVRGFDPGAPSDWTATNTFPTVNQAADLLNGNTQILSGTLVSANKDGIVLTLTLNLPTGNQFTDGVGNASQGFIDITYNPEGTPFQTFYVNGLPYDMTFYNHFAYYPNTSLNGLYASSPGGIYDDGTTTPPLWDTSSYDPIYFTVLPEPASLSLLGMALVGLGGRVLRRRSK